MQKTSKKLSATPIPSTEIYLYGVFVIVNKKLSPIFDAVKLMPSTHNTDCYLQQDIEDVFGAKKKDDAVFVDLTAAYDIVWHWLHLQASETSFALAHNSNNHGAGPEPKCHS